MALNATRTGPRQRASASLFCTLLDVGLVDTVQVAVLLGGGIPLFPPPARETKLKLTGHKIYERTVLSVWSTRFGTRELPSGRENKPASYSEHG
jgi:hypothetical protein